MNSDFARKGAIAIAALALLVSAPLIFYACGGGGGGSDVSALPGPVTGLAATGGNTQVELKWNASPGVRSYDIYWQVDVTSTSKHFRAPESHFRSNMVSPAIGPFYTHSGLHNGWIYQYWVVATGADKPAGAPLVVVTPSDGSSCQPGASCSATCYVSGEVSCGVACKDLASDSVNCGACGNQCDEGDVCASAACVIPSLPNVGSGNAPAPPAPAPAPLVCAAPTVNCGGVCRNTQTDANNCGSCGNACPAGQVCTAGACPAAMVCWGPAPDACGGGCTE